MRLVANNRLGLLDSLVGLGEDELDVAGVGHVGVDLRHVSFSMFCPSDSEDPVNVRGRERGMCGGAAWGPG